MDRLFHKVSLHVVLHQHLDDADPNDDAEVFSGPVRGGDYDDDYGFFLPRPRVRILVVPVSRDSSDYDDSDSSAPGLFSILRSIIASR